MKAPLLTDAEKKRIREEEIFREEVRREITPPKNEFWLGKYANSPLGIWFLSTVVIGVVTYAVKLSDARKEEHQRYYRIKEELMRDCYDFGKALPGARDYMGYTNLFVSFLQRPTAEFYEFKNRTMGELTWKLGEIAPEQNVKDGRQIRTAIEDIWQVILPMQQQPDGLSGEKKGEADRQILKILSEKVFPIFEGSWDDYRSRQRMGG